MKEHAEILETYPAPWVVDTQAVTVLGIDPGPTESAYAYWDGSKILKSGKIPSREIIDLEPVDVVAIECCTGYGMAVGQEVFETCRFEGRYEAFFEGVTKTIRVRRRDVKSHLCENPAAKDRDIIAALTDRIGPKGTKKAPGPTFGVSADIWAALATAIYAYDIQGKV